MAFASGRALSRGAATARAINVFRLQRDTQAAVQEARWLFERIDSTLLDSGAPWLVSLDDYPALRAWLQRVEALPAFLPMAMSAVGLRACSSEPAC